VLEWEAEGQAGREPPKPRRKPERNRKRRNKTMGTKEKVAGETAKVEPKVAPKVSQKKPRYAVKVGRVVEKVYGFESTETNNEAEVAVVVQKAMAEGHSAGIREVIVSIRS